MRFLIAPIGSRGDVQPLLGLAVRLKSSGHDVTLATGPNYEAEARAFGIPFVPVGLDIEAHLRERRFEMTPVAAATELFRQARLWVAPIVETLLPLAKEHDIVVGAGPQISAPTAAEAAGKPYWFVAYTPLALRSDHHMPFTFPVSGPRPLNRLGWTLFYAAARAVFGGALDEKRRALGMPPVGDSVEHFFPHARSIVACDGELFPAPPDLRTRLAPVGAFHLPDDRPLGAELERFLDAGDPPVYLGFGSMSDPDPLRTSRHVVDAARACGARLVLSSGWAGLHARADDRVFIAGAVPHAKLFPRCALAVHHGGAGTTSAVARAGIPQVIVPHAFDQIPHARRIVEAGLGSSLARPALAWRPLAERIAAARDRAFVARARALGDVLRARDGLGNAIGLLAT